MTIFSRIQEEGTEWAQKRANDTATIDARINANPDTVVTQESARGYNTFANVMDGPVSKAWSYGADLGNPLKSGPGIYGFYKGATECVCVGVPSE